MIIIGLDMYLSAKRYVYRHEGIWSANPVQRPEWDSIMAASGLDKFTTDESTKIYGTTISVTAAYWRKANAIHNWFVDNCQEGVDNCQEVEISIEDMLILVDLCNQVLADNSKAEELLPPTAGFFFGSTEIDEWYLADLEYTSKRLTELAKIAAEEFENQNYISFTYQASW